MGACIAAGGKDVTGDFPLGHFPMGYAYPLNFTKEAWDSRLFGGLTAQLKQDFSKNVTTNWHSFGISPEQLAMHASTLKALATNVALNGNTFVSAFEGRNGLP